MWARPQARYTHMPNKPKIFVCQNSTFWLRLYASSHTFSKSLGGIFASFLLVNLAKVLGIFWILEKVCHSLPGKVRLTYKSKP